MAASCDEEGTTWFFSSCGGILELQREIQASSSVLLEMSRSRAVECSLWLMAAVGLAIALRPRILRA